MSYKLDSMAALLTAFAVRAREQKEGKGKASDAKELLRLRRSNA